MIRMQGEELIAAAGAIAWALAQCMSNEELAEVCELWGLVKHDIDIIRYRRK